jgi:hypothetical protein
MLKRIGIYCIAFVGVWLVVSGYYWFRARQVRAEAAKSLESFFAEEIAQKKALELLGDVDLNPSDLGLAKLQEELHQPALKQSGAKNTTRVGWACGAEHCAIWADFLVPFGQEIPPTTTAAGFVVNDPAHADSHRLAIGGIHIGETVGEMQKFCQQRGYGVSMGTNRMSWNKDWNLIWGADINGKVGLLVFMNENLMHEYEDRGDVNSSGVVGVPKKTVK